MARSAVARGLGLPSWNESGTVFMLRYALAGTEPACWRRVSGAPAASPRPAPPPEKGDDQAEDGSLFRRVIARLDGASVAYRRLSHEPTRTSAESAAVRGVAVSSGAKAMLLARGLKPAAAAAAASAGEPSHYLVVLSASRQLDLKAARRLLGKRCKFASPDEVRRVTGAIVGAVPPFGSLFEGASVQTIVDASLVEQGPDINFNCGLRGESVCGLAVSDYLALEAGHRLERVAAPPADTDS